MAIFSAIMLAVVLFVLIVLWSIVEFILDSKKNVVVNE